MSDDNNGPSLPGFGWVARLTRWSRNDVTVRGIDGPIPPRKMRRADAADRADDFDQALLFGSQNGMLGLIGGSLQQFFNEPRQRHDLYRIYDQMDKTELPGTVLDLFAEESTHLDPETQRVVWVKSKDDAMVAEADNMLGRLRIDDEAFGQARDTAKFGDNFERIVYASGPGKGVYKLVPQHPQEMMRKETKEGRLEGYTQVGKKFRGGVSEVSYAWDYVHFRLRGQDRMFGYGTSILRNAIRPWRQWYIMDDWALHYQVSRAPDRNLLILDAGASSETDAAQVQRAFRQRLKRHMVVDPTGTSGANLDYRYNPITPTEDMVLTVRNNSNTKVEKFAGSQGQVDMLPLNYLINKFFAAVRAPKGFFGFDDQINPANLKADLCTQDIKFARRCKNIQKALRLGYTYLLELHYTLLMAGDPENRRYDFNDPQHYFEVHMAPISFLEELERLEVMQIRQQVGMALSDMSRENAAFKAAEWTAYILRDIIKVPAKELRRVLRTAEEMAAVQDKLLQAKGTDVNTTPAVGAGVAADAQREQTDLQRDQNAMAAVPPPDEADDARESIESEDAKKLVQDAVDEVRARGPQHGGDLGREDMRKLSEVIAKDPKVRRAIEHGVMLWRDDKPENAVLDTGGAILPERTSKVFQEAALADEMSQDDLVENLREARRETDSAGS